MGRVLDPGKPWRRCYDLFCIHLLRVETPLPEHCSRSCRRAVGKRCFPRRDARLKSDFSRVDADAGISTVPRRINAVRVGAVRLATCGVHALVGSDFTSGVWYLSVLRESLTWLTCAAALT